MSNPAAVPARRTVPRAKVLSVLVAVALLTLAAVGHRLSDDDRDFAVVRGPYGEFTALDAGSVRVDDVRLGTRLAVGSGEPVPTPGLFVVVRVSVRATGRDALPLNHLALLAQGTRYDPVGAVTAVSADPGFESTGDVAFEVAPDRITDLTVEAWSTQGFVVAYGERLRVNLGVTAENADAWRRAGQDRRVTAATVTATRGLG